MSGTFSPSRLPCMKRSSTPSSTAIGWIQSKKVCIVYRVSPDCFEITITDEGSGFDQSKVRDCRAAENLELPCGRGLLMMRHFMTEIEFNECGNSVSMRKVAARFDNTELDSSLVGYRGTRRTNERPTAMSLTPMMQQYREAKELHPDMLLLFRMGDFYELFNGDAEVAANVLGLALTSRDKTIPMAGFPHHALEGHLRKLLQSGHRVAICDQVEDPALAKGLVRREVTRVVTPGTLIEDDLLDPKRANHLVAVHPPSPYPLPQPRGRVGELRGWFGLG